MYTGYQKADFKNIPIALGTPTEVKGLYDLIEGTKSPIVVVDAVIDSKELKPFYALFNVSGDVFVATVTNYKIVVDADDKVTVSKIVEAGQAEGVTEVSPITAETVTVEDVNSIITAVNDIIDSLTSAGYMADAE